MPFSSLSHDRKTMTVVMKFWCPHVLDTGSKTPLSFKLKTGQCGAVMSWLQTQPHALFVSGERKHIHCWNGWGALHLQTDRTQ